LESKYILYVPFFFRTAGISYYMIVPSFYLYIVFVLKKRNRLRWTDTVHALPALFYFIDYLPFFLSSSQYKLQILNALLNRNQKTILNFAEGWIMPPKFHFLAPVILALVYIFFVARILFQYYRFSIEQNKKLGILRWLTTATTLYFLLEGTSLAIFLFIPSHQWLFTVINILLMYFTMSLILFSDPYLLYGRYFNATYSDKEAAKKHKQLNLTEKKIDELKKLFENYINKQYYLNQNTNLKEVANKLNTQPYVLSTFINQIYQMHFNDIINQHRIKYIEEGLTNEKWSTLTLEAIAEKAGFNNRITFLTAFKKFTGITPTQYIKKIQETKKQNKARGDSSKV
jgi:AraC-like DNA-binding protein